MSYKAWMHSPDGFLSLRPYAGSADTDQLIVPTLHLQVHCMEESTWLRLADTS